MCESDNSSQPVTLLQSTARLAAAVILGLFNSLVLFLFITPPLAVWLIWKYPYIAIPSAVAYYFLSFDGSELKDGRPWKAFIQQFWLIRMGRSYHDMQLHLDPSLEPSNMTGNEQFVFALHPHGILADYRILMDSVIHEYFPKLRSWRVLAASVLFKFPIWREATLWSHCIDADKNTAQFALSRGHSLFIVPGGEQEQILGEFGKEVLYLKKRMGFIKLALRNGIPVVPVYVFGANDTFRTSTFLRKTRLALVKRLRLAFPLFWGRFGLPIPLEVRYRIVFGSPLKFDSGSDSNASAATKGLLKDVSEAQLIEAHGMYINALKKLFDQNKARFGYADRELIVM